MSFGSSDVVSLGDYDEEYLDADVVHGSHFSGKLFMVGVPIKVKITGSSEENDYFGDETMESGMGHHRFRGWRVSDKSWYKIRIEHGDFEWTIRKTIDECNSLHASLVNRIRIRALLLLGKGTPLQIGHCPSKIEIAMGGMMGEPKKQMEEFLLSVLDSEVIREAECVVQFFEVSPLSFASRLGTIKWKEDLINKIPSNYLLPLCCLITIFKQPRWLVLKDTYLIYMTRKIRKMGTGDTNENTFEIDRKNGVLSLPGRIRRNWRLCKVFLMDQEFAFRPEVHKGLRANFLKLYNTHGKLITICPSTNKLFEWNEALTAMLGTQAVRDYVGYNRFGSFAPPRQNTQVTVFIDGAYYMEAVARAIAQAQHEIFITDWCMNPELFLRRPIKSNTWRLDKLLQAKARQGVRICVILYAGIEKVVPFCSAKTAGHLRKLHPNIHVYLSPLIKWFWSHHEKMVAIDQSIVFMGGIDLCFGRWDTVDHKLEDIHKSVPITRETTTVTDALAKNVSTQDSQVLQIEEVYRIQNESLNTKPKPSWIPQLQKSPSTRRRFSLHFKTSGDSRQISFHLPKPFKRNPPILTDHRTRDLDRERSGPNMNRLRQRGFTGVFQRAGVALHALFTRRTMNAPKPRSHSRASLAPDDNLMFLESQWGETNEFNAYDNPGFLDDDGEPVDQNFLDDLDNLCEIGQHCTFVGQDYVNWNVCEPDGKQHPAKDLMDRDEVPRMPWHDIGCVLSGQIAADFSRHFIQRWNAIRTSRIRLATRGTSERERRRRKPLLIPAEPCAPWTKDNLNRVLRDPRQASDCQAQALRSVSIWSLTVPAGNVKRGFRTEFRRWLYGHEDMQMTASANERERGLETSILSAYVNSILDAKNFILIENQFFISYIMSSDFDATVFADTPADPDLDKPTYAAAADTDPHERLPKTQQIAQVKNRIVDAIFLRIVRAHREGKPFRVFIILPLVPGFTGEFGNPTSRSQHMIWHYTRLSLFSGEQALFPRLARRVPDPNSYVSVCGLRTFAEWPNGNLKTELIYVHSKVMVVDDRLMIVGSANLNDRSTRGKRDSELAVVIENNPYQQDQTICPFVRRFRRSLMAEHLGVLPTLERVNRDEWSDELLNDPVCDEFYNGVWQATAQRNSDLFEEVFNVIPCNGLKTFNDCKEYRQKIPMSVHSPMKARQLLKQVRGSLVRFPDEFLAHEDLTPPPGTLEKLAPASIWL